jgi:sulfur carrier protein
MDIMINGTAHQLPDDTSLDRAVALISTAATGIAVAVNGSIVRRPSWPGVKLANGDQVEVLTAVQGG